MRQQYCQGVHYKKTILSEKKENAGITRTKKKRFHPPSGTTHKSSVQQQAALQSITYETLGVRTVYQGISYADSHKTVEPQQQSIGLVRSAGDNVGAGNSAAASRSSSIPYRYVSYENYAGTRPPPRCKTNINYETVLAQLPKQMKSFFQL